MGVCIEKIGHSCGSGDGLQVFTNDDGTISGFCFSCGTYVDNPYGEPANIKDMPEKKKLGKSAEEIEQEIGEIESYPVLDLTKRKLKARALNAFSVKVGVSTYDGKTPDIIYYPYRKGAKITAYKVKLYGEKRMWTIGDQKDVDLFGWLEASRSGARKLIITEGEEDAMAVMTMYGMHQKAEFKDFTPAICSLPHGSGSAAKDIAKLLPKIRAKFKDIVLCFDDDEPGHKAVEEVCKICPEAVSVSLPCKDANDCLLQGRSKAAFNAITFKAEKPKNSKIVWLDDVWESAKEKPKFGVSWPWPKVTEQTRGIRKGETIYIGSAQKMGKSEVVNTLAAHLVKEHDWKILLAKPEESNAKTAKLLAGKVASAKFHDPKVEFDEGKFDKAGDILLGNKVCMLDLYQHIGWESLKSDIIEASAQGIDAVFIDPITNLTNGMSAAEANTKLQDISQELAAMSKDLDIATFIFCHLRNPDAGPSHDRGGKVLTSQFAGSRAMGRSCNYMFGLEGDKDPDLPKEERNMRRFVCLDDREFGEVGSTELYWDDKTTQFEEV